MYKKKTAGIQTRKKETRKKKRWRNREKKRESDLAACFPDESLLCSGCGNQVCKCVCGCRVLQHTCLDLQPTEFRV